MTHMNSQDKTKFNLKNQNTKITNLLIWLHKIRISLTWHYQIMWLSKVQKVINIEMTLWRLIHLFVYAKATEDTKSEEATQKLFRWCGPSCRTFWKFFGEENVEISKFYGFCQKLTLRGAEANGQRVISLFITCFSKLLLYI